VLLSHLCFFSHSANLHGLPLSAVTALLHYLPRCLRLTAELQYLRPKLKIKGQKRPTKLLKKAQHSSETCQKKPDSSLDKAKFFKQYAPNNSNSHKNTSCVLTQRLHKKQLS